MCAQNNYAEFNKIPHAVNVHSTLPYTVGIGGRSRIGDSGLSTVGIQFSGFIDF